MKRKPVIVCTDKRGVIFGYADPGELDGAPQTIRLTDARMCVYWDRATKGLFGLAATGPTDACRVTAPVPMCECRGVHHVMDVSADAVARWEAGPWG